jgi:cysteine desulfurase
MSGKRAYLDHNATAPVRPAVVEAMACALARHGNPSSVHAEGRAARALVEEARDKVARLVGAAARDVVFTSGGTEAANAVLTPTTRRPRQHPPSLCLALASEHACVLHGARFAPDRMETLAVDRDGVAVLDGLRHRLGRLLRDEPGATILLSMQVANNETGVLQPVAEAAALVRAAGGIVHSDAVQAAGKIPLDIRALGVDVLSVSAHKLGGPTGVGALILANADLDIGDKLVRGGGQERGWRGGTENVAGIVGFGVAAELALADLDHFGATTLGLRVRLEAEIRRIAPNGVIFGEAVARLPNTCAFAVPGLKAETLLMRFDLDGVAVSSGSACSSGKIKRSHVLAAMGVEPGLAEGAIRVSFGWNSAEADVRQFLASFERTVAARAVGAGRRAA